MDERTQEWQFALPFGLLEEERYRHHRHLCRLHLEVIPMATACVSFLVSSFFALLDPAAVSFIHFQHY
jgi:hypothetical protein